MEQEDTLNSHAFDLETTRNLVGEMGNEILSLIHQGCMDNDDICRFSSISKPCLEVKIPLLMNLDLVSSRSDRYQITSIGVRYIESVLGWSS
jgi:predicted transcriptional regulator